MPATVERRKFPVESDPEKLTKFVCGSNILKTGQDVELKPDSEYPEWLFKIRLGIKQALFVIVTHGGLNLYVTELFSLKNTKTMLAIINLLTSYVVLIL